MAGAPSETKPIGEKLLDLVGLTGFEDHYPNELSGGMRQRVNLARALAIEPQVLLMDEPFAALDAQTREIMQRELLNIWAKERKTVLFITHQIDEAIYLADRVLVFSHRPGRIAADIRISFARPRDLALKRSPEFLEIRGRCLEADRGRSRVGHDRDASRCTPGARPLAGYGFPLISNYVMRGFR